jgi:malonate transporter
LREGRMSPAALRILALGILANPMIVSVVLGLGWGATGLALPGPINEFLTLLGAAATPCALFAIGASLAERRLDRPGIALWLTFVKLVAHPTAVAIACLWVFDVPAFPAAVMIAASALPVAGNVFILAQHYRVAPQRVSAAILMSTALSVLTVSLVVGAVMGGAQP